MEIGARELQALVHIGRVRPGAAKVICAARFRRSEFRAAVIAHFQFPLVVFRIVSNAHAEEIRHGKIARRDDIRKGPIPKPFGEAHEPQLAVPSQDDCIAEGRSRRCAYRRRGGQARSRVGPEHVGEAHRDVILARRSRAPEATVLGRPLARYFLSHIESPDDLAIRIALQHGIVERIVVSRADTSRLHIGIAMPVCGDDATTLIRDGEQAGGDTHAVLGIGKGPEATTRQLRVFPTGPCTRGRCKVVGKDRVAGFGASGSTELRHRVANVARIAVVVAKASTPRARSQIDALPARATRSTRGAAGRVRFTKGTCMAEALPIGPAGAIAAYASPAITDRCRARAGHAARPALVAGIAGKAGSARAVRARSASRIRHALDARALITQLVRSRAVDARAAAALIGIAARARAVLTPSTTTAVDIGRAFPAKSIGASMRTRDFGRRVRAHARRADPLRGIAPRGRRILAITGWRGCANLPDAGIIVTYAIFAAESAIDFTSVRIGAAPLGADTGRITDDERAVVLAEGAEIRRARLKTASAVLGVDVLVYAFASANIRRRALATPILTCLEAWAEVAVIDLAIAIVVLTIALLGRSSMNARVRVIAIVAAADDGEVPITVVVERRIRADRERAIAANHRFARVALEKGDTRLILRTYGRIDAALHGIAEGGFTTGSRSRGASAMGAATRYAIVNRALDAIVAIGRARAFPPASVPPLAGLGMARFPGVVEASRAAVEIFITAPCPSLAGIRLVVEGQRRRIAAARGHRHSRKQSKRPQEPRDFLS